MTNPSDKNPGYPTPGQGGSPSGRQETLLLSTVPNPTQLTQEMSAPQFTDPSLTTNTLTALSQRYDILGEAGHGAMGNVYKARDRETGETVALKLLKPEIASDQAMMERFKNELLFARKITHKNVCRVHEFNRIGGVAFTTMEFVEGESLRSVLNRFGGFPTRKGMDLALQICSGLQEAHAQGIVHRDLKPENVMIDSNGNVKIMDFGIARSMEALTKLTGAMIGTPAYMAPEQVGGKSVDYRTDIYSLGLVLYEMFTGSAAFQADTAVAVALKQMREMPRAPRAVEPSVPFGVERVIMKCLEKDPARRYQSAAELAAALRAPGVQGLNPSAAAFPPTQATIADAPQSRGMAPISFVAPGARTEPKQRSPLPWIFLIALAAAATWVGMRAKAIWDQANEVTAPAQSPAPTPPKFASEKMPAPTVAKHPPVVKPVEKPEEKNPAPLSTQTPETKSPPDVPAAKPANGPTPPSKAAPSGQESLETQQQRSEKVLQQDNAGEDTSNNKKMYLWIGRYQKEEGAQNAAKKLEDLGQPAVVLPRHGDSGEFFVVFTGPFPGSRVPSITQWLESQGFRNVRPVRAPFGGNGSGGGGDNKAKGQPNQ